MSFGRIFFLQRVFPPATGAAGAMLHELAGFLVNRGWEVHVICAGESKSTVMLDSIYVHQVKAAYQNQNLFTRAWSMVRARAAMERGAKRLPKPDLVVSLTDPPGLVIAGARIAQHHNVPHAHWSQDVYPEIAWQLGVISQKNPFARHLWQQSRQALQACAAVISISDCMTQLLTQRGIPPEIIHTIPNWTTTAPRDFSDPQTIRDRLQLPNRPILLYAGNFGRVHEFQTLLQTAANVPDWTFLLVGDGPRKAEVEATIQNRALLNTRLLPRQSAESYAQLQWLATAHCVTLDPAAAGCVLPSKIYSSLPWGRPIIYIGPKSSDAHCLAAQCGISVRNGEAGELAQRLNHWDSLEGERWSQRARELATGFTLSHRALEIEKAFSTALSGRETKLNSTPF